MPIEEYKGAVLPPSERAGVAGMEGAAASSGPSWLYFAVGTVSLATVAVLAGVVLVQFLLHRPQDVRQHTAYLSDVFEKVLEQHFVPAESVHRSRGEEMQDTSGRWMYHRFEIELPTSLNRKGLVRLLQEEMLENYVHMRPASDSQQGEKYTLSLGKRHFADVIFRAAPVGMRMKTDLRPLCFRVARDVEALLLAAGVREATFEVAPAQEKADADMRWAMTLMVGEVPANMTGLELKGLLERELASHRVQVKLVHTQLGALQLEIILEERVCVRFSGRQAGVGKVKVVSPSEQAPEYTEDLTELLEEALPGFDELPLDSIDNEEEDTVPLPPPPRSAQQQARVAIILDDGGYGGELLERVLALPSGLTLAILPGTPHDEDTALQAVQAGFEVMLHMPMETHSKTVKPFPGEVRVDMDKAKIRSLTEAALAEIPGAVGVNNHTGSRFTSDPEKMAVFLQVLQDAGLYFVDSRTIATTVAFNVAESMGIPSLQRDIFLDNENTTEAIQRQLQELIKQARVHGQAVGIGHFRKSTIDVLEEALPQLATQGVELVHVSELL